MNQLLTTTNRREIQLDWLAIPSVACKSCAIGVSQLTGINSEAISNATHSAIETTALDVCPLEVSDCFVIKLKCPFPSSEAAAPQSMTRNRSDNSLHTQL